MDNKQNFYSGGGAGGASMPILNRTISPSNPTAEIHDANCELGTNITNLFEVVANLESCLSPILRPEPQPGHPDSSKRATTGVPLADLVNGYSNDITLIRYRINALLANIAL